MTAIPKVARRPLERGDLERMNLPEEHWRGKLAGLPERAGSVVTNYIARMGELFQRGAGIALSGPAGVGKTALVSIIAREARIKGYSVFFTTVWDLREGSRNRSAFDAEQSVVERVRTVDLLVLDNLRSEDGADPFLGRRAIEELLAARASAARTTLLTTRLNFAELDDPKGPWRGLTQIGRMVFLSVAGPNLREAADKALRAVIVDGAPLSPPTGGTR